MPAVNQKEIIQIGLLVEDIHKSTEKWAEFLGVPVPEIMTTAGYEKTGAEYLGQPCYGLIHQSFFQMDNVEIELIQPIGLETSIWRDALLKNGEGVHHVALLVNDMGEALKEYAARGYKMIQKGDFPGGKYAYLDLTSAFASVLELLEFDDRKF